MSAVSAVAPGLWLELPLFALLVGGIAFLFFRWRRACQDLATEQRHNALLDRRLTRAERLYAESATPTLFFDHLGRISNANLVMQDFLRGEGYVLYQMDAAQLVAELTGNTLEFAQRCLRYILDDARPLALPVRTRKNPRSYLLRLYSLRSRKDETLDSAPIGGQEIRCDLQDHSALVQLDKLKRHLAGRVAAHLRNDLAAIELSASILATDGMAPEERTDVVSVIYDKVKQVLDTLEETQSYFATDVAAGDSRLPVDGWAAFETARQQVAAQAKSHAITFDLVKPDLLSYVLAAPEQLPQVFETIFVLLLRTASPGSQIQVRIEEAEHVVQYTLTNRGPGMSMEQLLQNFYGPDPPTEEQVALRQCPVLLETWDGHLEAKGTEGQGITVALSFRRFY